MYIQNHRPLTLTRSRLEQRAHFDWILFTFWKRDLVNQACHLSQTQIICLPPDRESTQSILDSAHRQEGSKTKRITLLSAIYSPGEIKYMFLIPTNLESIFHLTCFAHCSFSKVHCVESDVILLPLELKLFVFEQCIADVLLEFWAIGSPMRAKSRGPSC